MVQYEGQVRLRGQGAGLEEGNKLPEVSPAHPVRRQNRDDFEQRHRQGAAIGRLPQNISQAFEKFRAKFGVDEALQVVGVAAEGRQFGEAVLHDAAVMLLSRIDLLLPEADDDFNGGGDDRFAHNDGGGLSHTRRFVRFVVRRRSAVVGVVELVQRSRRMHRLVKNVDGKVGNGVGRHRRVAVEPRRDRSGCEQPIDDQLEVLHVDDVVQDDVA